MVLVMAFTVLGAALVNRRSIGWVRRRTHRRRNETHGRRRDGCDR